MRLIILSSAILVFLSMPVPILYAQVGFIKYKNYFIPISDGDCRSELQEVSSYSGVTPIVGLGVEINTFISNKIKCAGPDDSVKLNYFILRYSDETKYFYDSIVRAMGNGADIEIVSESSRNNLGPFSNKEFLDGIEGGATGIRNENGSATVVECDNGCDSLNENAINHNKIALLELGDDKVIVISTANVRNFGDAEWQAAIAIDGVQHPEHWTFWNKVHAADKCFAMNAHSNCSPVGDGGFEFEETDVLTSYLLGATESSENPPAEWFSRMDKQSGIPCSLGVVMGSVSQYPGKVTQVFNAMASVASKGCEVRLLANNELVSDIADDRFEAIYSEDTHAKLIVWNGLYDGVPSKLSWVGSLSFTNRALRIHDETMVRISNDQVYDHYSQYFESLYELANSN